MVQTVHGNKSTFTKKELAAADRARELYQAIRRPGYKVFHDTLQNGPLMGKTVCTIPKRLDISTMYYASSSFVNKYKNLTLAIYIIYLDSIPFLLTVSRDIHLYTIEKIEDQENVTLLKYLKKVTSMYNAKGFYVQYILADSKF